MANFFDQFDAPAGAPLKPTARPNFFDQFDTPEAGITPEQGLPELTPTEQAPSFQPPDTGFAAEALQPFKGFNTALAETAGRALDVVPYFASKALGGEGVHPIENLIKQYTADPVPEPQTPIGRSLQTGGQFVGESVPLLAGGAGLAGAGVRVAEKAAPTLMEAGRRSVNSILESFAQKPVATTASDVVSNVGAGAGQQIAKDNDQGVVGQTLAGVLGGMAPATYGMVSPTRLLAKAAPATAQKFSHLFVPDEAKFIPESVRARAAEKRGQQAVSAVAEEVAPILRSPGTQQEMTRVDALKERIPGFEPSLAQRTNDPVLLNKEVEIGGKATGDQLRTAQARHDQSAGAIRGFADEVAPPPAGAVPPEDIVGRAASQRVSGAQTAVERGIAGTEGRIREMGESLPEVDRARTGAGLREIRGTEQAAADQHTRELRAAIDPTDSVSVPTESLNAAIRTELRNQGTDLTSPNVPQSIRNLLDRTATETRTSAIVDQGGNPITTDVPQTANINSLLEKHTDVLQDLRRLNSAAVLTPEQIS
ncbi:MAG: hypothetical protein GEV06_16860, partial [Luteitalea sp.]|nr:hypothetical protein [Luteitalea sp.]